MTGSGIMRAGWCLVALSLAACSPPRTHLVEIRGMEFNPPALDVAEGDTVLWVNRDIVPHTATASGSWDTGTLTNGQEGRVVVQGGSSDYICVLHPVMKGTLTIR